MTPIRPVNSLLPSVFILGNSVFPKWIDIHQILNQYQAFLVGVDGGAKKAREFGLLPDLIIGDLDSITPETLDYFRSAGVKIEYNPDQENNDLEKCIRLLLQRGWRQFILAGFTGKRDDQTIATLQIARKYLSRAQFLIYTETAEIYPLKKGYWILETVAGQTVSLFGFLHAQHLTTRGLQFALNDENLGGGSRGLSNIATGQMCEIRFTGGNLLVVKNQINP